MSKTKFTRILIPNEFAAEEGFTVKKFQHDGVTVVVPYGEVTKVPTWVIEMNPNYAKYEVK